MADKCAEAANQICSEGKTEEEAGWKNVWANATTPEQPVQNITQNVTQPNITQPENLSAGQIDNERQSLYEGIKALLCPEFTIILGLLLVFLFIRRK
jgi:hypothetical protein